MEDKEYFANPSLSHSGMKNFELSPRHFMEGKKPTEKTPALIFGSAFHCFMLEPEKFEEQWLVEPKFDKRTKEGKAQHEAFMQGGNLYYQNTKGENIMKGLITQEMFQKLLPMREQLLADPFAKELLDAVTVAEKPLFWHHTETGTQLKGKYDAGEPDLFLLDLKTCGAESANPQTAAKTIINDYVKQGPLYLDGNRANGGKAKDFYFIFIEKEPPYGVTVNKLSRELIKYGRAQYDKICEDYSYWLQLDCPDIGYPFQLPLGYNLVKLPYWLEK